MFNHEMLFQNRNPTDANIGYKGPGFFIGTIFKWNDSVKGYIAVESRKISYEKREEFWEWMNNLGTELLHKSDKMHLEISSRFYGSIAFYDTFFLGWDTFQNMCYSCGRVIAAKHGTNEIPFIKKTLDQLIVVEPHEFVYNVWLWGAES